MRGVGGIRLEPDVGEPDVGEPVGQAHESF